MMRKYTALLALVMAPLMMGFASHNTWDDLEGEWAVGSTDACGSHVLSFTEDYKRDRHGAIEYPLESATPRRVRMATVLNDGDSGRRVSVGRRLSIESDQRLHIRVRRPASSPFRGWSQMYFTIVNDDTLQAVADFSDGEGDGEWLVNGMGGMPITLVRCP